jgi:hypothetical protein
MPWYRLSEPDTLYDFNVYCDVMLAPGQPVEFVGHAFTIYLTGGAEVTGKIGHAYQHPVPDTWGVRSIRDNWVVRPVSGA